MTIFRSGILKQLMGLGLISQIFLSASFLQAHPSEQSIQDYDQILRSLFEESDAAGYLIEAEKLSQGRAQFLALPHTPEREKLLADILGGIETLQRNEKIGEEQVFFSELLQVIDKYHSELSKEAPCCMNTANGRITLASLVFEIAALTFIFAGPRECDPNLSTHCDAWAAGQLAAFITLGVSPVMPFLHWITSVCFGDVFGPLSRFAKKIEANAAVPLLKEIVAGISVLRGNMVVRKERFQHMTVGEEALP